MVKTAIIIGAVIIAKAIVGAELNPLELFNGVQQSILAGLIVIFLITDIAKFGKEMTC
jgi:hypothetical protein